MFDVVGLAKSFMDLSKEFLRAFKPDAEEARKRKLEDARVRVKKAADHLTRVMIEIKAHKGGRRK